MTVTCHLCAIILTVLKGQEEKLVGKGAGEVDSRSLVFHVGVFSFLKTGSSTCLGINDV